MGDGLFPLPDEADGREMIAAMHRIRSAVLPLMVTPAPKRRAVVSARRHTTDHATDADGCAPSFGMERDSGGALEMLIECSRCCQTLLPPSLVDMGQFATHPGTA